MPFGIRGDERTPPTTGSDLDSLSNKWQVPAPSASPSASRSAPAAVPGSPYDDNADTIASMPIFWGYGQKQIPANWGWEAKYSDAQDYVTIKEAKDKTLTQAITWFQQLPYTNQKQYQQYRVLLEKAGIVTRDAGMETATEAFGMFLLNIGSAYQQTGKKRTPEQWLQYLAANGGVGGSSGYGSSGGGGFSGTLTQTSKNVQVPTDLQSEKWTEDAFIAALGRAPTKAEVDRFNAVLKSQARKNPAVTTTSTTYEDGSAVSSSSETTGGFGADEISAVMKDRVQSQEGYAEYQAVSTYWDALMGALSAPGGA